MVVRDTSLLAYIDLNESHTMGKKQREVYRAICTMPGCTNEDIAQYLHWPINCVTGRRKELEEMGVVQPWMRKKNSRGKMVWHWIATKAIH